MILNSNFLIVSQKKGHRNMILNSNFLMGNFLLNKNIIYERKGKWNNFLKHVEIFFSDVNPEKVVLSTRLWNFLSIFLFAHEYF